MTRHEPEPNTHDGFVACVADVERVLTLHARLPSMPFRVSCGHVAVGPFDHVLGSTFVPVLAALMEDAHDKWMSLVVVEPSVEYYVSNYRQFPAVRLGRDALATGYWDALAYEPDGDPGGALAIRHPAGAQRVSARRGG